MKRLKDMISTSSDLSEGLKQNGLSHVNYKNYTTIERAMDLLLSGYVYLCDGSAWNDTVDREYMKARKAYGMCFSYSTRESVAMWMLYGGNRGKTGAILNFYPSVIKELCGTTTIELGKINERRKFECKHKLNRNDGDFDIFVTDVIYGEECKGNKKEDGNSYVKPEKLRLSLYDENITVNSSLVNNKDVFVKNYAWIYERECRLIVELNDIVYDLAQSKKYSIIRIGLSDDSIRKMSKERVIRSPIFDGKISYGRDSELVEKVEWNL